MPYQGIAPILTGGSPWGLARVARALREACRWNRGPDVYSPQFAWDGRVFAPDWSEQEDRLLAEAFQLPLETDALVVDFAQTSQGNCALVATVKAAMKVFGRKLFKSVKRLEDGFRVTLRDGAVVSLTEEEVALARDSACLKGAASPTKTFAIFAYAVAAARRAQLMPAADLKMGLVEGWLSEHQRFERALEDLRSGQRPRHCANYLGVGSETRVRAMAGEDPLLGESTVVSSFGHAVYVERVDGTTLADHYGQSVPYDGTDTNGRPVRERLTFEGPGLKEEDGWFYI
ncbi:MAG: hypothetical protein AB7S38_24080 [Vulcanimicrobiota bacterium]